MLHYFRTKRNETSKRVYYLNKSLKSRLGAAELQGKTAVERLAELKEEQDIKRREIQRAKCELALRNSGGQSSSM